MYQENNGTDYTVERLDHLGACMKKIRQLALYLCPSSALCKQLHGRTMRLLHVLNININPALVA